MRFERAALLIKARADVTVMRVPDHLQTAGALVLGGLKLGLWEAGIAALIPPPHTPFGSCLTSE
jgi:hypothetical protein